MGAWLYGRFLVLVCLSLDWLTCAEHHSRRHHHGANYQHEEQIRHRRQRPADASSRSAPQFVLTDYHGLGTDELKEDVQDSGPWLAWSELSPCSRTCDGGVASQSRRCLDEKPSNESVCRGASKRHFSCNVQDCPENTGDFRSEQCSEFNNTTFEGRYYEWIPYTKAPNKCELNCMPRGERFYYRHKRKVIDGTRCSDEGLDICVDGECLPVGCDLMLGSKSQEDKCRECGGDGSACTTVEGVFESSHLQVGYNDILLIPVGATNIVIREKKAANNYLAVRNSTGHYYLNGNWRIDFPRDTKFAGTTFHYERKPHSFSAPESITALGPVTEALYVVLLYQEQNPGIEYEYSVPKGVSQPQPDSYAWIFASWSDCSATCGGGLQTRNVSCAKTTTFEVVPNDLCDPQLQPPTNRSCATEPCPASWYKSEWTQCSSSCGGGIQFRTVHCQQIISGSVPSIIDDEECVETVASRPISLQTCNEGVECPTWHLGPWSACDRLCGEGHRHRPVTCHRLVDGVIQKLDDEACQTPKPPTQEGCFARPCEGVDWITTQWSGCEDRCGLTLESREVACASAKGRVFPEKYCQEQRKPALTRACAEAFPCVYAWYASQWSQCSSKCGAGVQTRRVFCGIWEGTNLIPVADEKCDPAHRYDNVTKCAGTGNCTGSWAAGPWSQCSKACGGGTQERKVVCLVGNETGLPDKCDADNILFSSEKCNNQACGADEVLPTETDKLEEECEEVEEYVDVEEGMEEYVDEIEENMSGSGSLTTAQPARQTTLGQGITLSPINVVPADLQEGSGDEPTSETLIVPVEASGSQLSSGMGSGLGSGLGLGSGSGLGSGIVLSEIMGSGSGEEDKENGGFMTTNSGFLEEEILPVTTEKSASAVTKKPTTKPTVTTKAPVVDTKKESKPVSEKPKTKKKQKVRKCRVVEVSSKCDSSEFGCCSDNLTPAKGPFEQGCAKPKTCADTEFGCCTDGVTAAEGLNHLGCPSMLCKDTLFGCCSDGMTEAEGPENQGCKMEEDFMLTVCKDSEFGCCPDGISAARGPQNLGCSRCDDTSGDIEGSGSGECETRTSGSGEDTAATLAPPSEGDCSASEFGCCPDGLTPASGENNVGCDKEKEKDCQESQFGCCPDQTSAANGPNYAGCVMPCTNSTFGCCPDGVSAAHGPNNQGCCLTTRYGCCPDNITPAGSPNLEGCGCDFSPFGCCPDNKTAARGTGFDGCGCQYTPHGCCPDQYTPAVGPDMKGCPCSTHTHGCCPDGVTIAKGPKLEGCGCEHTAHGCCPDGRTPAPVEGESACPCVASRYGCCLDGEIAAQGPWFEGCAEIPVRGEVCGIEKDRGLCRNFTVKWFFDLEYGGCSRFWYGGCDGNGNRFVSQEECKTFCVEPQGFEACSLPKVPGPCEGNYPSWHHDAKTGTCQQFNYGGCLGNNNRFSTSDQCQQTCIAPKQLDVCHQTKVEGLCRGNFSRWHYDSSNGVCQEFTYGGCQGNGNNFLSSQECDQRCKESGRSRVCSLPVEEGNCSQTAHPTAQISLDTHSAWLRWYHDASSGTCRSFRYAGCGGNENHFHTLEACENTCLPSSRHSSYEIYHMSTTPIPVTLPPRVLTIPTKDLAPPSTDACRLPRAEGSCSNKVPRWYFDAGENRCMPFYYGGCAGNTNRFETVEECERTCPSLPQENVCALPQAVGDCTNYTERFFYDGAEGRCRPFYYGGCGGNTNNFESLAECSNRCHAVTEVEVEPESSPVFDTKFCFLPREEGPCKESVTSWYYDSGDGVCKQFLYGGCQGNQNRFANRQECEDRCSLSQDLCNLPRVVGPCSGSFRQWFYDKNADSCYEFDYGGCQGNPNRFNAEDQCIEHCQKRRPDTTTLATTTTSEPSQEHRTTQAPATTDSSDICRLDVSPGPCRASLPAWYYNATLQRCQAFSYGGCDGNANRFQSEEHCQRQCGDFRGHDVCSLSVDAGPCRGQFRKFYFDVEVHACREFRYGGCRGNGNRFSSLEECQTVCFQRSEVASPGNATAASNADVSINEVDVDGEERAKTHLTTEAPPAPGEDRCAAQRLHCASLRCPYGMESSANGEECEVCQCLDPCKDITCPEGSRCTVDFERSTGSSSEKEGPRNGLRNSSWIQRIASCKPTSKPGECPAMQANDNDSCEDESECRTDADCGHAYKCCNNGCGYSCMAPATKVELTTPAPKPVYTAAPREEEPRGIPPRIVAGEPQVLAEEGSLATLHCDARGTPTPAVYWRRGADQITSDEGRFKILVDGSLQVLGVDRFDAGLYTCIADNGIGSPAVRQVRLDVKDPTVRPGEIISDGSFLIAVLGGPIVIHCHALGWPRPSVTWWRGDRMLPLSSERYEQSRDFSLSVRRVSFRDLGPYTCQAYNGYGKAVSSTVIIQAVGPVYSIDSEDAEYRRYLVPPPQPDPALLTSTSRARLTPSTTTPLPRPSRPTRTRSTSTTPALSTTSTTTPAPRSPPTVLVVPTARLTSEKSTYSFGSDIMLHCEVTGYPAPTVDWYKDGVRLESRDRFEIRDNHTVLIARSEASDSGSYSCEAINQAGRGTSTTSITVEGVSLHPNCTDNPFFANCKLIVKARYCTNKYYARFCCRSCTLAGQLPSAGPHLLDYKTEMTKQLKSGYLLRYKRRIFSKAWREEYIVLYEDSTIAWFKDKFRSEPAGGLMLKEAPELMAIGQFTLRIPERPDLPEGCSLRQLMAFGTSDRQKVHWFVAKSEEEVNDWMTAISNTLPLPPEPPLYSDIDDTTSNIYETISIQRPLTGTSLVSPTYAHKYLLESKNAGGHSPCFGVMSGPPMLTSSTSCTATPNFSLTASTASNTISGIPPPLPERRNLTATVPATQSLGELATGVMLATGLTSWGHVWGCGLGWSRTCKDALVHVIDHEQQQTWLNHDTVLHTSSGTSNHYYDDCHDHDFDMDFGGDFGF